MKKLIILLLFIPLVCFGQTDTKTFELEEYKLDSNDTLPDNFYNNRLKTGVLPLPVPNITLTVDKSNWQGEVYKMVKETELRSFEDKKQELCLMKVALATLFGPADDNNYWYGRDSYINGSELQEEISKQNQYIKNIEVYIDDKLYVCEGNGFSETVKKKILEAKKGDQMFIIVNFSEITFGIEIDNSMSYTFK